MGKIGDGAKFKKLESLIRKKAKNPAALAAYIGRKKYGAQRMAQLSALGRVRAAAERKAMRRVKV